MQLFFTLNIIYIFKYNYIYLCSVKFGVFNRSSDSAKCGAGGSQAPVSRQWRGCGGVGGGVGGAGVAVTRRPPAAPGRARLTASGSQRSLLSVASDSATSRRPRDLAPRCYPTPVDGGFSLFVSGRFAF